MILPSLSFLLFAISFIKERPSTASAEVTIMPTGDRGPLTSHVLDTARGRPAAGIKVVLYKMDERNTTRWRQISEQRTDSDGRISNVISNEEFTPAVYKLYFDTLSYYTSHNEKTFYPFVEVVFEIESPNEHYHVPILLSAYGYSTYRGS